MELVNGRPFDVQGLPKWKSSATKGRRGRLISPRESAGESSYEDSVAKAYSDIYGAKKPFMSRVCVTIFVYLPTPKGKSPHRSGKPSLDRMTKTVMGGLRKASVWENESQVSHITSIKAYSDSPHIHVDISEIMESPWNQG